MEERLDRKDWHLLLCCLVVTALSLAVGIPNFYRAFPEASIDFALTREQSGDQALAFLAARGIPVDTYRHSAAFQYDTQAKTFLERELGLEGATALIGHPVRLWRWSNRWTRELQKEELQVELTTTGELVGFAHLIEEERPGAHLAAGEARQLAEAFLVSVERDPAGLDFVEVQTIQRPQRTDYSFTWKLAGFEVKDATYRFSVGVQGDQVGRFAESLKIPEAWQRDYQKLRSANEATGMVAALLLILTWVGLLYCLVRSARRQEVRWKSAAIFGLIAFALTFLSQLNELPVSLHDAYQTTQTFGSFLTRTLLVALMAGLGAGLFIAFIVAGAEPVYRRAYPHQLGLYRQFLPQGLRTKRFLLGSALGLALTAFFFAYQTLFYLTAEHFGAWSPADIPYSEMVNTYFPWITVLLIGFMPAVMEEFTSRAFSIPFLGGLLKSRWAAVVLSAFIWGFAHANYPQQPFYIRGLEVGIGGLIVGAVMLRWGLWPALAWHYTVDALYTALILLRSSNPYYVLTAALSAGLLLVPLLIAVALYLKHRTFADPTPLLNSQDTSPELPAADPVTEDAPALPLPVQPTFSHRRVRTGALALAAGAVVFLVEAEAPLGFVDFGIDRQEATRDTRAYLQQLGVEVDQYQQVVFAGLQADPESMKYLLQEQGLEGLNHLYRRDLQAVLWEARFYQPLQKEEYLVALQPDGTLRSVQHQVAEEAPGADLGQDQARALAEIQLRTYGLDPAAFELKEASSEKLAARRDHRLVWEALPGDDRNVGEARYRCEVKIAGDQPATLQRYLKLPEAWLRERNESTLLRSVLQGTLALIIAAVVLHLLWLVIRQIRGGDLEWPPLLAAGALGSGFFMVGQLNSLPTFYQGYDTSLTPTIFALTQGVGWGLGALFIGLAIVGALALAATLYPHSLAYLRPSSWRGQLGEGLLLAGLAVIAAAEMDQVEALLAARFSSHLLAPPLDLPSGLDTWLPGLQVLLGGFRQALLLPLGLGLAVFYLRAMLKKPVLGALALVSLAALSAGVQTVDAGEFGLALALALLRAVFWAALLVLVLRDHIPAYILTGFLSFIMPAACSLWRQSASFYQLNGALVLPAAGLVLVGWWWAQRRNPIAKKGL